MWMLQVTDITNVLRICMQIVTQNISTTLLKTLEIMDQSYNSENPSTSEILATISREIPLIKVFIENSFIHYTENGLKKN